MAGFKGTREAFAQAMIELAEKDDRVMFVSPDSLKAMRATKFAEMFPDEDIGAKCSGHCSRAFSSGADSICGNICRFPNDESV